MTDARQLVAGGHLEQSLVYGLHVSWSLTFHQPSIASPASGHDTD
jgi:hypothetical protein